MYYIGYSKTCLFIFILVLRVPSAITSFIRLIFYNSFGIKKLLLNFQNGCKLQCRSSSIDCLVQQRTALLPGLGLRVCDTWTDRSEISLEGRQLRFASDENRGVRVRWKGTESTTSSYIILMRHSTVHSYDASKRLHYKAKRSKRICSDQDTNKWG